MAASRLLTAVLLFSAFPLASSLFWRARDGAASSDDSSDGVDAGESAPRPRCNGKGQQFCNGSYLTVRECPDACKRCRSRRMKLDYVILGSGEYDAVFLYRMRVCVTHCRKGREGGCVSWTKGNDVRYCEGVRCARRGLEGCHQAFDFEPPSCEACTRLFPSAGCPSKYISGHSSSSSSAPSSSSSD